MIYTTLTLCFLMACLTLLCRQAMKHAADDRAATGERLKNLCAVTHEWTVIDVRPMEGVIPRHVTALYRCKRCGVHWSGVYAGEWTVETFMRTEADAEWWKREVGHD